MESLKQYFKFHSSFKGRMNRKAYIFISVKEILLLFLYIPVLVVAIFALMNQEISKFITVPILMIIGIILFVIVVTGIVLQTTCLVKRTHDLNLSGYWVLLVVCLEIVLNIIFELVDSSVIQVSFLVEILLLLIALVMFLGWFIGCLFIRGTKGDNKYGPDPLEKGNLHIPRLSRLVLKLLIFLPVICFISLTSIIVFKTGVSGGLENMQKSLEGMETALEERQMERKKQCELIIKRCEGTSEGDAEEEQWKKKYCDGWIRRECEKMLEQNINENKEESMGEDTKENVGENGVEDATEGTDESARPVLLMQGQKRVRGQDR